MRLNGVADMAAVACVLSMAVLCYATREKSAAAV